MSRQRTIPTLALSILALFAACDDNSDDAQGSDGGYTLSDIPPDAESIGTSPTAITFSDVDLGDTDIRTVRLLNHSTASLSLTNISLVDTDATVRFDSLFLRRMGESHGWVDSDGDGHSFEVRPQPVAVAPGQSLEVILRYRPDGTPLECRDRPPAPCGHLVASGIEQTVSVPLYIPR